MCWCAVKKLLTHSLPPGGLLLVFGICLPCSMGCWPAAAADRPSRQSMRGL